MSFARRSAPLAAVAAALAGCGGAHTATPQQQQQQLSPAAAWHRVVLCARSHGMPNLADPQINANGKAIFPDGLNIPDETRRACQALLDRLIPSAREHDAAPTPAQLAGLLRFARCMRSHGIPDWPDPQPDGTFHPGERILGALKSTYRSQLMACERYNPDPEGNVYFSRS